MLKSSSSIMYRSYNQDFRCLLIISFVAVFLLLGCSSSQLRHLDKQFSHERLNNSFHALTIVDAATGKVLFNRNGDKYFTPASNVKIVTLLAAINLLPDCVPALQYVVKNDSIFFEGTGDPSWLHPYFQDTTAITFLKNHDAIFWHPNNSNEPKFGSGWAWEDYDTYFSPEKSVLPLYGNVVTISNTNDLQVSPSIFSDQVAILKKPFRRGISSNQFFIPPGEQDTLEVPFVNSTDLTMRLMENVLGKKMGVVNTLPAIEKKVLPGISADSIYKRMLFKSDNFLAEQLLLMASSALSDTLNTQTAISYMLKNQLSDLVQQPRWVDGSGLSRYNLFTPKSLVQILQKINAQLPEERLFHLFPMWDESGTVDQWNMPETEPFIYAKSGSLGNNYNLSGYLITRSGKLLIFSFMNNHFKIPTAQIRADMFEALYQLHLKY